MQCVQCSASSFGSGITHSIVAGFALKSPTAGALSNPQRASRFQTIKCRPALYNQDNAFAPRFQSGHSAAPNFTLCRRNSASLLNCKLERSCTFATVRQRPFGPYRSVDDAWCEAAAS